MPLLETCFCCSLAIAAGFIAVYLLIGYVIAFAFELLWLLESDSGLPIIAALLCAGYFIMALFAAILVHGLATKNTLCLLGWMFTVTILTFPEAGMVIYMSIQYWSIESLYGMTELVCWLARVLANVFGVVIVQSLYSTWKEEELVMKRLHQMNLTALPMQRDPELNVPNSHFHNNAYAASIEHLATLKRSNSIPNIWSGSLPNNLATFPLNGLQFCTTQSEFNASIYVPNIIHQQGFESSAKRAQSLMDLRNAKEELLYNEKLNQSWYPFMTQSLTESSTVIPTYTFSLDRKLNPRGFSKSLENLNINGSIRSRNSFYEQQPECGLPIYYGPLHGPDFLVYKKQVSKNSLSNASDDLQKYRDVAL